ncbi:Rz1-like lysis system protein LysC [Pseudomonas cremoricolorata]|uniref:Rz1-like lysis system protein LysC n=1 Tax=Pseudomonas cremoricolorata TaxID=157783 RepID=UPI001FDF2E29|nr:Rz1-like lysis system protein LysC [Pseudomonas cremoricolorata]
MKTPRFALGLPSLCLTLLAGCASAPPSAAPPPTISGCPAVVPCQLPATRPTRNGELLDDLDRIEQAWAECAAQIDSLYRQQVNHEQTR